jgi:hypothetical protein
MDAFTRVATSPGYPSIKPSAATGYGTLIPPTVKGDYGQTFAPISLSQPHVAPDVVVFSFKADNSKDKAKLEKMKRGTIVGISTVDTADPYTAKDIVSMNGDSGLECLDSAFITVLMSDWTTQDMGQTATYSGSFVVQGACAVTLPDFVGMAYGEGGSFRVSTHTPNDDLPLPRAYAVNVENDDPNEDTTGSWPAGFVKARTTDTTKLGFSEYGRTDAGTWTAALDGMSVADFAKNAGSLKNGDPVPFVWAKSGEHRGATEKYTIKAGMRWPRVFRTFTLLTRPVQVAENIWTARCDVGMHANYGEYDGLSANETYALVYKTPPFLKEQLFDAEDAVETARVDSDNNYENKKWEKDVANFVVPPTP